MISTEEEVVMTSQGSVKAMGREKLILIRQGGVAVRGRRVDAYHISGERYKALARQHIRTRRWYTHTDNDIKLATKGPGYK